MKTVTITTTFGGKEPVNTRHHLIQDGNLMSVEDLKEQALSRALEKRFWKHARWHANSGVKGYGTVITPCKSGGCSVDSGLLSLEIDVPPLPQDHVDAVIREQKAIAECAALEQKGYDDAFFGREATSIDFSYQCGYNSAEFNGAEMEKQRREEEQLQAERDEEQRCAEAEDAAKQRAHEQQKKRERFELAVDSAVKDEISRLRALPIGSADPEYQCLMRKISNATWHRGLNISRGDHKRAFLEGKNATVIASYLENDTWMIEALKDKFRDRLARRQDD